MTAPIIVAGLPRSGAGAVIAMLEAAGLHPMGDLDIHAGYTRGSIDAWLRKQWSSSVYRLLEPHSRKLPLGVPFRIVMVTRDHQQQARSQRAEFERDNGRKGAPVYALHEAISKHEGLAIAALRSHGSGSIHRMWFETLINNPRHQAAALARFLDLPGEKAAAMAAVIRRRDPRYARHNSLWPPRVA